MATSMLEWPSKLSRSSITTTKNSSPILKTMLYMVITTNVVMSRFQPKVTSFHTRATMHTTGTIRGIKKH